MVLIFSLITDWNMGVCLFGFELLQGRVAVLFVAGTYRIFLICFGVDYWFVLSFLIVRIIFHACLLKI